MYAVNASSTEIKWAAYTPWYIVSLRRMNEWTNEKKTNKQKEWLLLFLVLLLLPPPLLLFRWFFLFALYNEKEKTVCFPSLTRKKRLHNTMYHILYTVSCGKCILTHIHTHAKQRLYFIFTHLKIERTKKCIHIQIELSLRHSFSLSFAVRWRLHSLLLLIYVVFFSSLLLLLLWIKFSSFKSICVDLIELEIFFTIQQLKWPWQSPYTTYFTQCPWTFKHTKF